MQTAGLSFRHGGGAFVGLVFFLAVVTVVPFGVGPDLKLLSRIGPAILWIGALLATLLGLDRLFRDDRDDGSLDLLVLTDVPLEVVVLAKCAGAWLATGLPLVIVTPVLGLLLGVEPVGARGDDADAARRHAGADADRRHRRGADHGHRPRRAPDRGAGAAVHHPAADLRGERGGGGHVRRGELRAAVPDPGGADADQRGGRPVAAAAALRSGLD